MHKVKNIEMDMQQNGRDRPHSTNSIVTTPQYRNKRARKGAREEDIIFKEMQMSTKWCLFVDNLILSSMAVILRL